MRRFKMQILVIIAIFCLLSFVLVSCSSRPVFGTKMQTDVEEVDFSQYKYYCIIFDIKSYDKVGPTKEVISDYFFSRGFFKKLNTDKMLDETIIIHLDVEDGFCIFPGIGSRRPELFFTMPIEVDISASNGSGKLLFKSHCKRGFLSFFRDFSDIGKFIMQDLDKALRGKTLSKTLRGVAVQRLNDSDF